MPLQRFTRLALALSLITGSNAVLAENLTPNLQINGFATAGVTWIDDDQGGGLYNAESFHGTGISEDPDFGYDNVLGLQLTYTLNDRFDLVGQLVSEGKTDYSTELEWGYIAYRLNDNLRFRAGRFAAPYYMYSQTQRVGQSYPWVRPPIELYSGVYEKSLDGVDMQYRQTLTEDWRLDAQLYYGGTHEVWGRSRNAYGLNLNFSNSSLTLHAGYGHAVLDWQIESNLYGNSLAQANYLQQQFGGGYSTSDNNAQFLDAGFIFDNGEWLAIGEFGQLDIDGWGPSWNAGYLTVGHYFGKALPFVSAAKLDSFNGDECNAYFAQTEAAAAGQSAQLQAAIAAQQTAAGAAAAAAAQATATAANQLAANDLAGYAASIQTATQQQLIADGLIAQIGLETVGLGQITTAQPLLAASRVHTCGAGPAGGEQTSYSLGLRYDATRNVSVKAQVDHVADFGNGSGLMGNPTRQPDKLNVFTFTVNAAF